MTINSLFGVTLWRNRQSKADWIRLFWSVFDGSALQYKLNRPHFEKSMVKAFCFSLSQILCLSKGLNLLFPVIFIKCIQFHICSCNLLNRIPSQISKQNETSQ
jgi:hypothetical protein